MDINTLKFGLIAFWGLWFLLVILTNIFESLKALRVLPENWQFNSTNYSLITKATAKYSFPAWLNGALFAGAILWQIVILALYWLAFQSSLAASKLNLKQVDMAFIVSIGLWAAFILTDEVFRTYQGERAHRTLFTMQLITLIAIHLL